MGRAPSRDTSNQALAIARSIRPTFTAKAESGAKPPKTQLSKPLNATRQQTTTQTPAHAAARGPGDIQNEATSRAAAKGCKTRAASSSRGKADAATAPPSALASGTITSGANRKSSSITPNGARPVPASQASTTQAIAPNIAEVLSQVSRVVD